MSEKSYVEALKCLVKHLSTIFVHCIEQAERIQNDIANCQDEELKKILAKNRAVLLDIGKSIRDLAVLALNRLGLEPGMDPARMVALLGNLNASEEHAVFYAQALQTMLEKANDEEERRDLEEQIDFYMELDRAIRHARRTLMGAFIVAK